MKIAFIADAHLGQTQYGMSFREDDYEAVLREAFDKAKEAGCQYVILGGDMFHTVRPPARAIWALKGCIDDFSEYRENDLFPPVLSIDGNHDNSHGRWMELCGACSLDDGGDKIAWQLFDEATNSCFCRVYGINGGSTNTIMEELKKFAADVHSNTANILVLHLPLAEAAGFPTQVSCTDIANIIKDTDVKLVLLGDIHESSGAIRSGIQFIYPGSLEITAANEKPKKSFLIVDVNRDPAGELTFDIQSVPVTPRKQVSIKIASEEDMKNFPSLLPGKDKGPLYHIEYDGSIVNVKERLTSIATGAGAYFRCLPMHTERQIPEGIDRSGFKTSLADIVEEDFKDNKDAKDILLSMLSVPIESAMQYPKKYLNKKGIKVPS